MSEQALNEQDPQPAETQPDPLEELRREKDSLQDRLLRTAAEFDNYRKRVERERRELADYMKADVLAEIHKQMLDFLRKRGVTPIEALGADFDPNFHQAVIHETSPSHREGEVIAELQRGYMLGDKLLRPAMVKVAKAA
jgi:molecular chaperone GrpE